MNTDLAAHLAGGLTTVCRAWAITRKDGRAFGFTDHDMPLEFDGITFKADSGLSAVALQQGTGLAVDNTEAIGALSDAAVTEADIEAGRFDGAEVRAWLVNWADPDARWLQFRGSIGELRRAGGAFRAELRGLTEALNRPLGRVFQKPCTAVLGDGACGFDANTPGYNADIAVAVIEGARVLRWPSLPGFAEGWFTRGRLSVETGPAAGLWRAIKLDRLHDGEREVQLWEPLRAPLRAGDMVRLQAGCDKRAETCRLKFDNFLNFQGFPDIPGEDWLVAYPRQANPNSGGSLR
ncbi:MAG: DUF2163 domain-containing protein [Rhodobacteraceae bacterium]|nr:DUF2163 domain-containing protein [Paracoccaceae bacterium]